VKRASLTLFLTLLVAGGLALWLKTRAAPHEDPPALPAPEFVAAADRNPAPLLEREPVADAASASERALAVRSSDSSPGAPDGCHISGWVWRLVEKEKLALADVSVKLWPAAADGSFSAESKPCAETRTGEMGSFRFAELARGVYFVAVDREGCSRRLARLELSEARDWQTVDFVIGTGRVEGLAWAFDGDARPTLELESTSPRRRAEQRWLDPDKRFAFEDLPAGTYVLRARWRTSAPGSWREESSRIELADGELKRIEVGSPGALPHWRGSVHVAGGELPQPGAALRFEAGDPGIELPRPAAAQERADPDETERLLPAADALALTRMQDDPALVVRAGLDAQGRFDVALPPRGWKASLELEPLSHRAPRLRQASLADGHIGLDLVCPGSRIRGRVLAQDRPFSVKGLRVLGDRLTGGDGDSYCTEPADAGGSFVIDAVDPGSWKFAATGLPKGWKCAAVPLVVGKEDGVLELELRVQKP
jgi:hypothetical protein